MIYLACPYYHESKTVRGARFKAVTEFAEDLIKKGHSVFCEATYIHAFLEANPDLSYGSIDWKKTLRPIKKACDSLIVYQLPGWKLDKDINETYNYFVLVGDKVTVQGPVAKHLGGPYGTVWSQYNL